MEEGTILSWLHAPGDAIRSGEELVEIGTDKASMVYESDAAGTLLEIVAPARATVSVGDVIARIGPADAPRDGASGEASFRPRCAEAASAENVAAPPPAGDRARGRPQDDRRNRA
jgi:pyruvate/2-oxoglutarate dehydrogenase complex dihydrolipoamide acyltransferase (E2) component